jgi:acetamidase/formamidase
MATHRLEASPETVHWGFFDAKLAPQLTVESGDTVTITTVSGTLGYLPKAGSGLTVPPALQSIHDKVQAKLGGPHILTGPVAVRGAKAGQVLEVRIKAIELFQDWGYNTIRPLAGALPDDFKTMRQIHIPLDKQRMIGKLPWGLDLDLKPFFGIMAVAPPAAWGETAAISTTRNWSRAPRSICRSTPTAHCSPAATATACRATAKSASRRSRPDWSALSS